MNAQDMRITSYAIYALFNANDALSQILRVDSDALFHVTPSKCFITYAGKYGIVSPGNSHGCSIDIVAK